MKKNLKKLLIFLSILILLAGIYIFLRLYALEPNQPESSMASEQSVLILPRQQIQSVRIFSQEGELTFLRTQENNWQIDGYDYPLSSIVINAMIGSLSDFQARLLPQAQSDLSVYGLGIPRKTVEISLKNGNKALILFGDKTPLGTHYYMQVHGKKEVFLVSEAKWDLFSIRPHQYWDISLPEIDWQNITHMRVSYASRPSIELAFRKESPMFMHYEFLQPRPYRGFFASSPAFYRLWQDWAQNPPQKHNLEINVTHWAAYGLHAPQLSFSVSDKKNNKLDLEIGHHNSNGDYYARLKNQNYVFTLSKHYVQSLLDLKPFSLLNKFVALIPKDQVSFFVFTTPTQNFWGKITNIHHIEKMNFFTWYLSLLHARSIVPKVSQEQEYFHDPSRQEIQYYFNGMPVKDEDFLSAYQRMVSLSYEAEAKVPHQRPQVIYSLAYYNYEKDLISKIDFLSYDTRYYLVRLNGYITPFLIGQYQLEELTEIFERL